MINILLGVELRGITRARLGSRCPAMHLLPEAGLAPIPAAGESEIRRVVRASRALLRSSRHGLTWRCDGASAHYELYPSGRWNGGRGAHPTAGW